MFTSLRSRIRAHPRAATVAAVCLGSSVVSIILLVQFFGVFFQKHPPSLFYIFPIYDRQIVYASQQVTITDTPEGDALDVTFAGQTLHLLVSIPPRLDLPNLRKHEDWFRLLLWRPDQGFDESEQRRLRAGGEASGNLAIVTRTQRPGTDPETTGEIFKSDWVFDFYEFLPEGGGNVGQGAWRHTRLHFPESDRAYARRVRKARSEGRETPPRRPDELHEGTWFYHAAMSVMPEGASLPREFNHSAMMAAGWRWSLASLSVLGFLFGAAFTFAPDRPKAAAA
ncbi:MAG: hypothetical protein IT439_04190 [Phycisphaerales bacterium]|nr:hypothetical protein [Phycisphaerales bacterium]